MNSREICLNILSRVFHEHGYASLLMRNCDHDAEMGFVSECVYGTIRNRTLLEYQWKEFADKTRGRTETLLDMAVYELFFMHTPDYAVIDEANRLAVKKDRAFVNAVLRKVQKRGFRRSEDPSVSFSMPSWLISLWKAQYGEERMKDILKVSSEKGTVIGRLNPLLGNWENLTEKEHYSRIDDLFFTSDIPIVHTQDFREGRVMIQNPSSALPVRYLKAEEGMNVLDVCASPGTKTQLIACDMHDTGHITACDLYEKRLCLIDDLMKRTGVHICTTKVNDGTKEHAFAPESFDRILCDVPCSGLGDLKHKPEIRWNLTPQDLDEIVSIQKKILSASSEYLKKGGLLVYSTCTLNRKENEKQILNFLREHEEFELMDEKTIFPDEIHDGFYVACMRKKD